MYQAIDFLCRIFYQLLLLYIGLLDEFILLIYYYSY